MDDRIKAFIIISAMMAYAEGLCDGFGNWAELAGALDAWRVSEVRRSVLTTLAIDLDEALRIETQFLSTDEAIRFLRGKFINCG